MRSRYLRHSSHEVFDPCETELGMLIGYARTSTLDQTAGFEAQLTELAQAGCEKVFREQVSSVAPRARRLIEQKTDLAAPAQETHGGLYFLALRLTRLNDKDDLLDTGG